MQVYVEQGWGGSDVLKGAPHAHARASAAQTLTEMDGVTEMWWPQAPHPSAVTRPCDGGVRVGGPSGR